MPSREPVDEPGEVRQVEVGAVRHEHLDGEPAEAAVGAPGHAVDRRPDRRAVGGEHVGAEVEPEPGAVAREEPVVAVAGGAGDREASEPDAQHLVLGHAEVAQRPSSCPSTSSLLLGPVRRTASMIRWACGGHVDPAGGRDGAVAANVLGALRRLGGAVAEVGSRRPGPWWRGRWRRRGGRGRRRSGGTWAVDAGARPTAAASGSAPVRAMVARRRSSITLGASVRRRRILPPGVGRGCRGQRLRRSPCREGAAPPSPESTSSRPEAGLTAPRRWPEATDEESLVVARVDVDAGDAFAVEHVDVAAVVLEGEPQVEPEVTELAHGVLLEVA